MLRDIRERAGLQLEALSSALKVPAAKLDALERNDFAALPGATFARGLASNVCRYLGADPRPVLALMPDDRPRIHTDDEALNTPFSSRRIRLPAAGRPGFGMPGRTALLIGLLMLAALLLFLLPSIHARWGASLSGLIPSITGKPATRASEASAPASPTTVTQVVPVLVPASGPAAAVSAPAPMPAASSQGLTLAPQLAASMAPPVVQPASSAASAVPAAGSGGLVLKVSGDTWVQVRNTAGKTIYERTLGAGQEEHVDIAAYPVRVVVGRAENVQLLDRGQPFDLSAVAKTGVARFDLK